MKGLPKKKKEKGLRWGLARNITNVTGDSRAHGLHHDGLRQQIPHRSLWKEKKYKNKFIYKKRKHKNDGLAHWWPLSCSVQNIMNVTGGTAFTTAGFESRFPIAVYKKNEKRRVGPLDLGLTVQGSLPQNEENWTEGSIQNIETVKGDRGAHGLHHDGLRQQIPHRSLWKEKKYKNKFIYKKRKHKSDGLAHWWPLSCSVQNIIKATLSCNVQNIRKVKGDGGVRGLDDHGLREQVPHGRL